MENAQIRGPRTLSRRAMVKTGAAVGAGAWVAPSILSYDRAYAAVGSCGDKPVQLDWSDHGIGSQIPLSPSTMTADDGVVVTAFNYDPDGVQDSSWNWLIYNGTINGRTNPIVNGMSGANNGEGVTLELRFSVPVQPSFFVMDVDRGGCCGNPWRWEDSVEVNGYLLGGSAIDPDSITEGGTAVQAISATTVRGQFSSSSTNSEAEYDFQEPVDTITIRHYDRTRRTGYQWIGVHDLHWC